MTRISHELVSFLRDGTRTVQAGVFSMANWLLDAACLYVCLLAFAGDHISPPLVLTAYGFASLVGLLPLTPGGLGVIEGTLIPLLIALGTSSPVAVLGVLTWRVLQFWLPVPVAAVCYAGLRISRRVKASDGLAVSDPSGSSTRRVRKALGLEQSGLCLPSDGRRESPVLRRCVVLDVALVALTIAVFVLLALVLRGLEHL